MHQNGHSCGPSFKTERRAHKDMGLAATLGKVDSGKVPHSDSGLRLLHNQNVSEQPRHGGTKASGFRIEGYQGRLDLSTFGMKGLTTLKRRPAAESAPVASDARLRLPAFQDLEQKDARQGYGANNCRGPTRPLAWSRGDQKIQAATGANHLH